MPYDDVEYNKQYQKELLGLHDNLGINPECWEGFSIFIRVHPAHDTSLVQLEFLAT